MTNGSIEDGTYCTVLYPGARRGHHRPSGPYTSLRPAPMNTSVKQGVINHGVVNPSYHFGTSAVPNMFLVANVTGNSSTMWEFIKVHIGCTHPNFAVSADGPR